MLTTDLKSPPPQTRDAPPMILPPPPIRAALAVDAPQGRDRRGPLRPERLVASRARLTGEPLVRTFRIVDIVLLIGLALAFLSAANPAGILQTSLGAALPTLIAAGALIWALRACRAYDFKANEPIERHVARLAAAAVCAMAVVMATGAIIAPAWLSLHGTAGWFVAAVAAIALSHGIGWTIVRHLRQSGRLTSNIIIVGAGKIAERLIDTASASGDIAVLGIFDDRADRAPKAIRGVPVLGDTESLLNHKIMPYVDKVVIAVPAAAQGRVRQLVAKLSVLPNPVTLVMDSEDDSHAKRYSRISNTPLAYLSGAPNDERRASLKRLQDIVLATIGLIAAAPIMAIIAVAIRLDSPGPVFFKQRRHGFQSEEILVWKFRSMRTDQADPTASRQVTADDDRVTKVGRFIRRTSIDELPQIFNVLLGEMSIVGPRPHAIGMKTGDVESARLVAEYAHRNRMKPGITGWAAIHGSRGPVDTPEAVRRRIELDIEYIERQSFWLDLYIMLMTAPCLLGDVKTVR